MTEFTIRKLGLDGFGSQMIMTLTAYLWALENEKTFYYIPFPGIQLVNVGKQDQEIKQLNRILTSMMKSLGVQKVQSNVKCFYRLKDLYARKSLTFAGLSDLHSIWPLPRPKPIHRHHKKTLSIHIRMGDDVEADDSVRCQPIEYYNSLIKQCLKVFPDHTIQLISWGNPDIDKDLRSKVIIDASRKGGEILRHYNMMIHSDILIIGSSTFSMSAGLLNPHTVLSDKNIIGISTEYPKQWNYNFEALLG